MLAVIPSNIDIATHEIVTKEIDPEGLRDLGVLTKPNLIDSGGEENAMSLVDGKQIHFVLDTALSATRAGASYRVTPLRPTRRRSC